MNIKRMARDNSILICIDFQERLMPVIKDQESLIKTTTRMIEGCNVLGVPIMATQQYTKGMGETVPALRDAIGEDFSPIEKTSFSCFGAEEFGSLLASYNVKNVLIAGVESHICVEQTVMDLLEQGYNVFLIIDAMGSRSNHDKKYAVRRMCDMGAIGTTMEAALFEMCVDAKDPCFKQISKIVK